MFRDDLTIPSFARGSISWHTLSFPLGLPVLSSHKTPFGSGVWWARAPGKDKRHRAALGTVPWPLAGLPLPGPHGSPQL